MVFCGLVLFIARAFCIFGLLFCGVVIFFMFVGRSKRFSLVWGLLFVDMTSDGDGDGHRTEFTVK